MSANLRLVTESGDFPWPDTGELIPATEAVHRIRDLEDRLAGYKRTIDKQAREIGVLARRVAEDEDPHHHPLGAEIVALIERWKTYCHHVNAKMSADRVKLVKARIRDGYTTAQIALAIDGLAAAPYVVNAQRRPTGTDSQRYDQLKHALRGGEELERFANLGHQARKAGAIGWPAYEETA